MPFIYQCAFCKKMFCKTQQKRGINVYCSRSCIMKNRGPSLHENCGNCNKPMLVNPCIKRNSKSGKVFCSKSCSATYNNTNKTYGTRVSKLEKIIQNHLIKTYTNLTFEFNQKHRINSELDIFMVELQLAVELNGIFHYEPIYGEEKLKQIQNNDNRKFQACLDCDIELLIIDTSQIKYLKQSKINEIIQIIDNVIEKCSSGRISDYRN